MIRALVFAKSSAEGVIVFRCYYLITGRISINRSRFFLCRCQITLLLFFSIKIQLGISRTCAVSRSLHHHTEIWENFHWFGLLGQQSLAPLFKYEEKSAPNFSAICANLRIVWYLRGKLELFPQLCSTNIR